MSTDRARIDALLDELARVKLQLTTVVTALARRGGNSERVVRLEFGIDRHPEVWAEDSERGAR